MATKCIKTWFIYNRIFFAASICFSTNRTISTQFYWAGKSQSFCVAYNPTLPILYPYIKLSAERLHWIVCQFQIRSYVHRLNFRSYWLYPTTPTCRYVIIIELCNPKRAHFAYPLLTSQATVWVDGTKPGFSILFIRFTLIQIDTSLLIVGDGNGGEVIIDTLTNILNQNSHRYAQLHIYCYNIGHIYLKLFPDFSV